MNEQLNEDGVRNIAKYRTVKVSNPVWLGNIGPQIKAFSDRINIPTITYETMYTYFARTVQYGKDIAEFWTVTNGTDVVAFAHWFVCDLPHRGVVFCDFIYSWNRMREPVVLLLDEYIAFGKSKQAPIYRGTAINETIFRVFRKAASKRGFNIQRSELVDFIGSYNHG